MKIGVTVICVDDANLPDLFPKIKKGSKYIVSNVAKCSCKLRIAIGIPNHQANITDSCDKCGYSFSGLTYEYYFYASRFRVLEPLYRTVEISKEVKELELTHN